MRLRDILFLSFLGFVVVLCCGYLGYLIIDLWADTGPGCPGDPLWLGYCSEVDGS